MITYNEENLVIDRLDRTGTKLAIICVYTRYLPLSYHDFCKGGLQYYTQSVFLCKVVHRCF